MELLKLHALLGTLDSDAFMCDFPVVSINFRLKFASCFSVLLVACMEVVRVEVNYPA